MKSGTFKRISQTSPKEAARVRFQRKVNSAKKRHTKRYGSDKKS